ncbi:MAG: hypothetical protein M3Z50_13620 [Actinomycetota bacterium]|nr:hypothetical protein [Actinomycetota bacterium]
MTDLDAAVLGAALAFAQSRLDPALARVGTDPASLARTVLGRTLSADEVAALMPVASAVSGHLTAAGQAAAALDASLAAGPTTLADVTPASAELCTVLSEVAGALGALAGVLAGFPSGSGGVQTLLRAAASAGPAPTGLAAQLALFPGGDLAGAVTVSGTTVEVTFGNPAGRDVGVFQISASSMAASLNWTQPTSLTVQLSTDLEVGLVPDGFVRTLVPTAQGHSHVVVTVDAVKGVTLGQGSTRRAPLPGSFDIGPVKVRDFALETSLDGGVPSFALTVTISGVIGPVSAVVSGAGAALTLDAAAIRSGAASPATTGPHAPTGAGLELNAGPIHGGGYISHSGTTYGGALDLALGPIEISAFGLIDTEPFSMVVVLAVRFTPGIQLSFGFTLNAVGGLVGINRVISTTALRAGLHAHTIDALLFPPDAAAAAPHILQALQTSFPAQPGGFVVGPMLELGWGTPVSLITARIGVLLSLPDPTVIILGALRMALPTADAAIIDVRAELYGEITADHILVLVSLSGSKIAGFPIGGDFGLLIGYGDNPDFALSAGGFHPHYKPPAELVGMRRVSIDLSPPAILTMRAEAYVALTTSSVQLGAFVQVGAQVGPVGADGHLSFDALVRWAPRFAFEIDLSAGISLYALGMSFASVDLSLHLEGPGAWIAHGTASVSLLFFDVDLEVGPLTWGDDPPPPPDAVSAVDIVVEALGHPTAWRSTPPGQGDRVARLREVNVAGHIVVHPLGSFEVRQTRVPLETTIAKVGPHPTAENRVNLGEPLVDGRSVAAVSETTDRFAPGQFLDLTDDQKLSTPAFEDLPSGMRFTGVGGDTFGTPSGSTYQWRTVYPEEELEERLELVWFAVDLLAPILAAGPAGRAVSRRVGAYDVLREPIRIADAGTVRLAESTTLAQAAGVATGTMTTTAANAVLADLALSNPAAAATVELVGPGVP